MARILIVDDDAAGSEMLEVALAKEGYEVDTASSGPKGLEQLRAHQYDLILLDWEMPGGSGIDFLQTFRANGGKTHVILISGREGIESTEVALDAGADDYLTKPFNLRELFARIRSTLRRVSEVPSLSGGKPRLKQVCLECGIDFDDSVQVLACPTCKSPIDLIASTLAPGSLFAGRYEIVSLIGVGGAGVVYKAKHNTLNREVALKVIHSQLAANTSHVQRFKSEAKAISKMSDPNIVDVIDFGISPEGSAYMILEYLQGRTLGNIMKEVGRIHWHRAVPVFLQICSGLGHAHKCGIIHRDLKPGNVMIIEEPDKGPVAKLVDFGLAKEMNLDAQITRTGDLLGTPLYMSPEQCEGGNLSDARSDIYSMGALMYHALVGVPPLPGHSVPEVLVLHKTQPPAPIPAEIGLSAWLQDCILKALEKDPDKRHQTIDELAQELKAGWKMETALSRWSQSDKT